MRNRLTVDPVFLVPNARDHAWSERSRGVKTTTGVVDSDQLCNEESETDTDRCHKGGFVLFVCQHVDGEDELGGENGFNLRIVRTCCAKWVI